ncbi:MAG: hypothetical protein M3P85_04225 [Actinomycetota bacterium]|nr:hypothetical protein [Actinomycetota bacterium]
MSAELQRAFEDLYGAFAFPRPAWFEGCECCWGGPATILIADTHAAPGSVRVPAPGGRRPLRELSSDEIRAVAAEVPLTAGTMEVFKHYMPRIFEIAAEDGFDWPDLEVVVGRLSLEERVGFQPWGQWPAAEQDAVRRYPKPGAPPASIVG